MARLVCFGCLRSFVVVFFGEVLKRLEWLCRICFIIFCENREPFPQVFFGDNKINV